MITKKTSEEIQTLQAAGNILATILHKLGAAAVPGATALDLDDLAMELVAEYQVEPVLLGYHPSFAPRPAPACQKIIRRRRAGPELPLQPPTESCST